MRMAQDRIEAVRRTRSIGGTGVVAIVVVLLAIAGCEQDQADAPAVADIVQVENIEPVTTEYIVANPTNVYNNHFVYDTEVTGQLERGETVEALGKVPGYEWLLVGRNGEDLGYVPISMLSPADLYIP